MFSNKINKFLNVALIFAVLLAILSLGVTLYNEQSFNYRNTNKLEKIKILGTYKIDGENKTYPLPADGNLGLSGHNTVIIEGYFDKELPLNKELIMKLDNLKVRIFVNDIEIYSFGQDNSMVKYAKSPGNLWNSVISPGISTTDKIRIELYNVYTNHVETTFSSFLTNMYVGYESILIINGMQSTHFNSFISIFIVCIGFISLGLACIMMKMKLSLSKLLYFGGLCISSGIWCFLDFNVQNYMLPSPVFNNSLDILSLLFSMFFLIIYFSLYLKGKCRYILYCFSATFIIAIIATTILQFLGIFDYYECLFYIQSASLIYTPVIVGCIFYEKKKLNNADINKLLLPTVILAAGIMGDALCNMFEIIPYIIWFKFAYLTFTIIQFSDITKIIRTAILEGTRIQILEELAYEDCLTCVKNRTAYVKKVETIKNNLNTKNPISVFVFDINNLKLVNDTLGHEAGDDLIKRSAIIISKVFNENNIYRIGGDEFVVIYDNIIETNYIETIETEIKLSNSLYLDKPPVSIAYGYAVFNTDDTCFEDVFSRADKNMYANKTIMKEYSL